MVPELKNVVVADVGGTNARFALVDDNGELVNIKVLPTSDYVGPEHALKDYLQKTGQGSVLAVCIAIACPVRGDTISMPNNHWRFSPSELEKSVGVPLLLINDFTAQALCLHNFPDSDMHWLGNARPETDQLKVIAGPGTGLGVAMIAPGGTVFPTEGGHVGFSPSSSHQVELMRILQSKFSRISLERVVSGQGLENLYWANSLISGTENKLPAREITRLAHNGDKLSGKAIGDFFDIFASACGDMALGYGAEGGVYLTGGVMDKLAPFLNEEKFRLNFENKGRFADYCAAVPIGVMGVENPGLLGCYAAIQRLK